MKIAISPSHSVLNIMIFIVLFVVSCSPSNKSENVNKAISEISNTISTERLVEIAEEIKNEYRVLIEDGSLEEAKALKEKFETKVNTEVPDKTLMYDDYCEDCLTNKGCLLNGCNEKCNWEAGYKCCINERGEECKRNTIQELTDDCDRQKCGKYDQVTLAEFTGFQSASCQATGFEDYEIIEAADDAGGPNNDENFCAGTTKCYIIKSSDYDADKLDQKCDGRIAYRYTRVN